MRELYSGPETTRLPRYLPAMVSTHFLRACRRAASTAPARRPSHASTLVSLLRHGCRAFRAAGLLRVLVLVLGASLASVCAACAQHRPSDAGSMDGTPAQPQSTAELPSVRPNIVLVLVDDLGQQDVSVPMLGTASALNVRFRTPNLERLAARGLRFSDAYAAAPVCTPSRTAILTGQCPARSHITYWTLDTGRDTSSRHARLDPPAWAVDGAQPTGRELPRLLAGVGYRTIHVGKAHFGARGTAGADPRAFGFEVNIAGHAAGAPGSFLGTDSFKEAARRERGRIVPAEAAPSVWDVPGLEPWHGKDVWLDDALAREACEEIESAVAAGRPFYLNFCPYGVHAPIMEDARFAAEFASLDATERAYATMVAAVDDALGRIVACCERLGVLDRTIVVFTSDNGGLSAHARGTAPDGARAHTHNAPLRSGKGSAYEGGLRVPLVVAGPGIPHEAAPRTVPIVGTDLYRTMLSFAGVAPALGCPEDGVDLAPFWRNGVVPAERPLLFHQPHKWGPAGPGIEPFSAVRLGDWKLIWFHDSPAQAPRLELYEVASDPGERTERSATELARLESMRAALRDTLVRVGAQLPIDRATGKTIPLP